MGDDRRALVAFLTLLGLGVGAYMLLRNERPAIAPETSSKSGIAEKKEVKTGKEEKFSKSRGIEWEDLKRIMGSAYPGEDMEKIYSLLLTSQKNEWRRRIFENGVNSYPDRLFVYYDSYYLGQSGNEELMRAFNRYVYDQISFDELLQVYRENIGIALPGKI